VNFLFDNYITREKARVKNTKIINESKLDELLNDLVKEKPKEGFRRAKANLNGIGVEFITNNLHQFDFWCENWWLSESTPPRVFLYSIDKVEGEEPTIYYCKERRTSIFINFDYYGQCKSRGALGPSSVILSEEYNTHSIHGACADVDGKGIIIIAPTGTGKTTQSFKLFLRPEGRIIGDDWAYVNFSEGNPKPILTVTQPEKSLYMRTENEKDFPWLRPIFDECKCENITIRKEDCENPICQEECKNHVRKCVFDEGKKWCYYAFGNSRVMVPREKLLGPEKIVDKTRLSLIVLLERVPGNSAEEILKQDEAIEILRKGELMIRPGAGPKEMWGKMGSETWYNPYPYPEDMDHKMQEYYFSLIFSRIPCIKLNTAVQTLEETHKSILRALKRCG
jgi:hypothetical protein